MHKSIVFLVTIVRFDFIYKKQLFKAKTDSILMQQYGTRWPLCNPNLKKIYKQIQTK